MYTKIGAPIAEVITPMGISEFCIMTLAKTSVQMRKMPPVRDAMGRRNL
jgi:hypothetical protein